MVQTLARTPQEATKEGVNPFLVRFEPAIELTEEQFEQFCAQNADIRIELTAEGVIEVMPPTKGDTGIKDADIVIQLGTWAKENGHGSVFGSSAGFTLLNGAVRSPDASWVLKSRLTSLTDEQKDSFIPICPDFVVELRSSSDRLSVVQAKMDEYMANGAQLGWLLDPLQQQAHVYRPGVQPEILDNPDSLSADPELPGFTLDLKPIWEPAF